MTTRPSPVALDRQALAEAMSAVMSGHRWRGELPFDPGRGRVKTYALEVNSGADQEQALDRAAQWASALGFTSAPTEDRALALAWGNGVGLFIDVLDPRFWLIHTTSAAGEVQRLIRRTVWASRDLDSCWFPSDFLRDLQRQGAPLWFKSDFEGDALLPTAGVPARKLRVKLEGDEADGLFGVLLADDRYRRAAALTSVATRLSDPDLGRIEELAHYRGRFVTLGDSFEMHVGFVSGAIERYRQLVETIERRFRFAWEGSESGGAMFEGEVLTIRLGQPIRDLDRFLDGLFSCRDPFRLWAVPGKVSESFVEAEVVDLHIGERFRMEITPDRLRLLLRSSVCGNTVLRLLANLQHRFDATVATDMPAVPT
jgi:hypothetical protein